MQRRQFLGASGAAAGGAFLTACVPRPTPTYPPVSGQQFEGTGPYPAGVGSADPTPTSVLLWTRVHPSVDSGAGVDVEVDLSRSPVFTAADRVATLTVLATEPHDHCVTVDAGGLEPGTTYWYRFRHTGGTSVTGRTKTAPAPGSGSQRVRIAAFSCQRWTQGWYTAHADLASLANNPATDIDLVVCLGDYVYDTGFADKVYVPGREDPIQDALTRDDFRSKYRLYRSDPNLQAVHALYPMVNVFDNHDGMESPGDDQAEGALGAFFEHIPVRTSEPGRIHRPLRWGDSFELFMTDQRSFRDPVLEEGGLLGTSTSERPEILDPDRTMLGAAQREWLLHGISPSTAQWKVLGSRLMFWPWRTLSRFPWQPRGTGTYLNLTQWDGYVAERNLILDRLEAEDVRDTLIFSGDSHIFSAANVAPDVDDPASVPRVVDFGSGSITSNNADESDFPTDDVTWPLLSAVNPNHLRFFESERHGYLVAEMTAERTTVEFRSPRTILQPTSSVDVLARLEVPAGTQRITRLA
ncbi:alkaline phosphatase D family protein [soil metagenome]